MKAARRRGVQARLLKDVDVPKLYLGYQRGAFGEFIEMNPEMAELDMDGFAELLVRFSQSAELWVSLSRSPSFPNRDRVPVGLWIVFPRQDHMIEPHVLWMPWATDRNKLDGMLRFFVDQRIDKEIAVFGETRFRKFWLRLAQYGVLSRVGTWPAYFPNGDTAEVWRVV